jgi:hypothetical protein
MRGARDWARRARECAYFLGLHPAGRHTWRHLPRFLREAWAYQRAARQSSSALSGRERPTCNSGRVFDHATSLAARRPPHLTAAEYGFGFFEFTKP